jgi:hypothetical protein
VSLDDGGSDGGSRRTMKYNNLRFRRIEMHQRKNSTIEFTSQNMQNKED